MKVGIVGLPNVGKSTLFNALLKKRVALSANYPFATIEPNIGIVEVPDPRLEKLSQLVQSEEGMVEKPPLIPAVVEFVDIAGLAKGAALGAGLGNQFLSHIREVDAIIHVLRDFKDDNIIRAGAINPTDDLLTVETELQLADLQVLEKLIPTQEKFIKTSSDPVESKKLEILIKIRQNLEEGKILGKWQVGDEKLETWFKNLPLLMIKPSLRVYNVDESEYTEKVQSEELRGQSGIGNNVMICAKLEEELADYSDEERLEYLNSLGIEQTGLERLVKSAYSLLGLISFLTAGKKEVRAWTIEKGSKAPMAAGVIHSDFEKGFIRASVIEYDKLIDAGSYAEAKKRGMIRTEGKEYIVKDGDVVEFLISS